MHIDVDIIIDMNSIHNKARFGNPNPLLLVVQSRRRFSFLLTWPFGQNICFYHFCFWSIFGQYWLIFVQYLSMCGTVHVPTV